MRPIDFLEKEERIRIRKLQQQIVESDDVHEIDILHMQVLCLLEIAKARYQMAKKMTGEKCAENVSNV